MKDKTGLCAFVVNGYQVTQFSHRRHVEPDIWGVTRHNLEELTRRLGRLARCRKAYRSGPCRCV